jgi:hypothetical protein
VTPEQFVTVLTALSVLFGAITAALLQLHKLELRVDGRLTELLALTKSSARAEGRLEATSAVPGADLSPGETPSG